LNRGEIYWRYRPSGDPRTWRAYLIVSRDSFISTTSSSVICVPIYSAHHGLKTQVTVGADQGLAHGSSLHCDQVVNVPKSALRHYVGSLSAEKQAEVDRALALALDLDVDNLL
jgi:mRNA interferase MazF